MLCDAAYWKRAWVIQAFLNARILEVWCGSAAVSGEILTYLPIEAAHADSACLSCARRLPDIWFGMKSMSAARKPDYDTSNRSLGSMFFQFRMESAQCSDVRDRIFSLLSLVSPEAPHYYLIVVDYSKSLAEFFFYLLDSSYEEWAQTRVADNNGSPRLIAVILAYILGVAKQHEVQAKIEELEEDWRTSWDRPTQMGRQMPPRTYTILFSTCTSC